MSKTTTLARRSQLGELLVNEGKITRAELEAALSYREERGLKLGQALVALHLVTQQDLAGALRSQGRVHCLHLTPGIVDVAVARLLPEAMARQYVAVPVQRVAGRVTVAMEDPAEEYDVDAIAVAIGEPVFAVHADPGRIHAAIAQAWPAQAATPARSPRLTLLRGPLPESSPDEAADALVRAALREARALGAESLHVEATARGAEFSFRVDGRRTAGAVLPLEWAAASAAALRRCAAGGRIEIDGVECAAEHAEVAALHGPCARLTLVPRPPAVRLEDLPLEPEEQAAALRWLDERGVVLLAGARGSAADALAADLAARCAHAGRRVYRLGAQSELESGVVSVPRGASAAEGIAAAVEQAPDVLETGTLVGAHEFRAALAAARAGLLVLARVEARDGLAAAARCLAAADERAPAAALLLGAIAVLDVRLACAACRAEGSTRAACAACGGTGLDATRRVAEALDLHGALAQALARGTEAARDAARDLGYPTAAGRAAELVESGAASAAEVERSFRRAEGGHA